ncbi:proteasome subunit beta type 3, putative [Babesia caballi]|uniref:thiol oxidase n=1 Tax=Babesia caballi TaxID=5871 RepID=A0AAV4LUY5_BABCB|nr:proteasome subunit beta type 3, putative [Babesia caballi]
MSSDSTAARSERRSYTFAESLAAVDRNEAIDPCSAQWMLIWMYGAYVDDVPSDTQRRNIDVFYRTLTDMCNNGKQCFQRFLSDYPPRVESRRALLSWVQMAENSCRIQNGLPTRVFKFFRSSNKGSSLQETSQGVDAKISAIDEKINRCNADLASIKSALANTNGAGAAAAKRKAMQVLQRRKVYEGQREQLIGVQMAVDQSEHVAAQVQTAVEMRNALSASVKGARKQLRRLNLTELEGLQEQMEDLTEYTNEINEIIGRTYALPEDVDENELELEFAMLSEPEEATSTSVASPREVIQRVKGKVASYLEGTPVILP